MVGSAQQAQSFPPNPRRPLSADTCEEATARLQEARRGSSLISPEENRQVVADAEAAVARLCGLGDKGRGKG